MDFQQSAKFLTHDCQLIIQGGNARTQFHKNVSVMVHILHFIGFIMKMDLKWFALYVIWLFEFVGVDFIVSIGWSFYRFKLTLQLTGVLQVSAGVSAADQSRRCQVANGISSFPCSAAVAAPSGPNCQQ